MRKDREGRVQWVTALAIRQPTGRRVDVIDVVVVGAEPTGVMPGDVVKLTGLVSIEWEMGDRHGSAWRAEAITPVSGSPAPAPRKGGE
ncbi:hypothetical protein ACIPV3_25055 [Streptomyces albidoflavus]